MNKKSLLICGEARNATLESTLAVELFLNENYCFRRNVLNGKVEFAVKPDEAVPDVPEGLLEWRPLTQEALNSIIRRAKKEQVCFRKPKEGEAGKLMNSRMLLSHIQKAYPSIDISHGNKVRVGQAMNLLGYESADHSNVPFYKVVPLEAA